TSPASAAKSTEAAAPKRSASAERKRASSQTGWRRNRDRREGTGHLHELLHRERHVGRLNQCEVEIQLVRRIDLAVKLSDRTNRCTHFGSFRSGNRRRNHQNRKRREAFRAGGDHR